MYRQRARILRVGLECRLHSLEGLPPNICATPLWKDLIQIKHRTGALNPELGLVRLDRTGLPQIVESLFSQRWSRRPTLEPGSSGT